MMVGVDDLDPSRHLELPGGDRTRALGGQVKRVLVGLDEPNHDLLDVENDVDHILDDTRHGRELMLNRLRCGCW